MLDRFEILKYALLFEEFIKKIIIKNIEISNINNNLNNKKIDQWKKSTVEKLKKYGKKNLKSKEIIFYCSLKDLPDLYKLLDYEIRKKIIKLPIFKKLMVNKQKNLKSILTANWLVRNVVAHPVLNLEEEFNKLSTFTFVGNKFKNNSERIKYFYKLLKKNLMCKSNFKLFNNKNFTLLNF